MNSPIIISAEFIPSPTTEGKSTLVKIYAADAPRDIKNEIKACGDALCGEV